MGLLLVAATAPRPAAEAAWAAWLARVDFEDLEPGATALLSLVRRNLPELAADPSIEHRVRGVHRQTWAANRVRWAAVAPLVDHLGAEVVRPLLLPPTALLAAHGDDWGARPLERLHVALPAAAAHEVRTALADTGWAVQHLTPALLARTHAGLVQRWQSQDPSGTWVTVRWHVLPGVSSRAADEQLRGAAAAATVAGSRVLLLHPADALLQRLWSSQTETTWGWIADAAVLARPLAEGAGTGPVDRFAERVAALGLHAPVADRLALATGTVGDPALAAALDALHRVRPGPADVHRALRSLPGPAAALGRAWTGHAAGQGLATGGRSLLAAQWTARRLRYRGSAQRR